MPEWFTNASVPTACPIETVFAEGRPVPVGWTTVSTLKKHLEVCENVTIVTNAKVTRLITESKRWEGEPAVSGVEYELAVPDGDNSKVEVVTLVADAVILTTGE